MPNGVPTASERIPEFGGPVGMDEELEGHLLAGVAGAGDDQVEAANNRFAQLGALEGHDALAGGGVAAQGQQDVARFGTLQGDIDAHVGACLRVAQVAQDGTARQRRGPRGCAVDENLALQNGVQPGPIFVIIGGIDHHQVVFFGAAVDQRVVDHVGIGIKELRVAGFAHRQGGDIVAADAVEEGGRLRAFGLIDAHVGNVEQTGCLAGGQVFFDHGGVPDRHFPTGKGHHLGAQGDVGVIEGGAAQGRLFRFGPGEFGQGSRVGSGFADEIDFAGVHGCAGCRGDRGGGAFADGDGAGDAAGDIGVKADVAIAEVAQPGRGQPEGGGGQAEAEQAFFDTGEDALDGSPRGDELGRAALAGLEGFGVAW